MTIAITCICGNTFAADPNAEGGALACPVCEAELRIAPKGNRAAALLGSSENRVLPDGDLRLRLEPRDEVVEVEVEVEPDEEDDGPASYAFAPERGLPLVPARTIHARPGFWASLGTMCLDLPAAALAYGPENRCALVAQGREVQILNMTASAKTARFCEHRVDVTSLALSPDGISAFSADAGGELLCWELPTRRVVHRRQAHAGAVTVLDVAPSGEYVLSGGADGGVRLWDLVAACRERRLTEAQPTDEITALGFGGDGRLLVAGAGDGSIRLWMIESGALVRRFAADDPIVSVRCAGGCVTAVTMPSSETTAAHPRVWRWNAETGVPVVSAVGWSAPNFVPIAAALDHEGQRLLVAGRQPTSLAPAPLVAEVVSEIGDAFHDFFRLAPIKWTPRIRSSFEVWSVVTGHRLHAFPSTSGVIQRLAVAPDNTRVLAALDRSSVRVFAMPGL